MYAFIDTNICLEIKYKIVTSIKNMFIKICPFSNNNNAVNMDVF